MVKAITAVIALGLCLLPALVQGYSLKDDYTGNLGDFFNKFSFWTDADKSGGYVDYVDQGEAWNLGLLGAGNNIYIGVDHANAASSPGRKSVRLTSNNAYGVNTLIVADINHMPETCGTWPAFWTTATTSTWPQQGEIDIIEQANNSPSNQMSIHVSSKQGGCVASSSSDMSGTRERWGNCTEESAGGCVSRDQRSSSFGSGFNGGQGGVYAMEWTADSITIWFFPRGLIPGGDSGPLGGSPVPSSWGTPAARFEGCDFDAHVKEQHIVIDTDFCGEWGTGSWASSGCQAKTGHDTCESYVQSEAGDFESAFWTFNSLKVYT